MAYPPIPRRVRVEFRERMSGWVLRESDALMAGVVTVHDAAATLPAAR